MRSFKSNENIHKKEGGSYYVVSANKDIFNKDTISRTDIRKKLISTYVAKHIGDLALNKIVSVIVDSELIVKKTVNVLVYMKILITVSQSFMTSKQDLNLIGVELHKH